MSNKSQKVEVKIGDTDLLSLKEAAKFLGIGEFRMRRILSTSRIVASKVKEQHFEKWYVKRSDLIQYRETKGRVKDGKKAYLVRLNEEELLIFSEFCKEQKVEITPRYVSKKK